MIALKEKEEENEEQEKDENEDQEQNDDETTLPQGNVCKEDNIIEIDEIDYIFQYTASR